MGCEPREMGAADAHPLPHAAHLLPPAIHGRLPAAHASSRSESQPPRPSLHHYTTQTYACTRTPPRSIAPTRPCTRPACSSPGPPHLGAHALGNLHDARHVGDAAQHVGHVDQRDQPRARGDQPRQLVQVQLLAVRRGLHKPAASRGTAPRKVALYLKSRPAGAPASSCTRQLRSVNYMARGGGGKLLWRNPAPLPAGRAGSQLLALPRSLSECARAAGKC